MASKAASCPPAKVLHFDIPSTIWPSDFSMGLLEGTPDSFPGFDVRFPGAWPRSSRRC